jgi:hypothetical protein
MRFQKHLRLEGCIQGRRGVFGATFRFGHMRCADGVGLKSAEREGLVSEDLLSQAQSGLSRRDSRPVIANVEIYEHIEPCVCTAGFIGVETDLLFMIDHDCYIRGDVGKRSDTPALEAVGYGAGEQDTLYAAAGHELRFADGCDAHADSACGYLPPRNLDAFVSLRVRAKILAVSRDELGHTADVQFECVRVEKQRRRR